MKEFLFLIILVSFPCVAFCYQFTSMDTVSAGVYSNQCSCDYQEKRIAELEDKVKACTESDFSKYFLKEK